jgi:hypothetical protein
MLTLTAPVLDAGTTCDLAVDVWTLHLHLGAKDSDRAPCVARVRYATGVAPEHLAAADQRRALQAGQVTVTATRWHLTRLLQLELEDAHLIAFHPQQGVPA